jgi:hypothetical protein
VIGANVTFTDNSQAVTAAVDRAAFKNMGHAGATIRKEAMASIEVAAGPSLAGLPPHTRRKQLNRAIRFDYDRKAQSAVIGPRESVVGQAGAAHELGEVFHGQDFPMRPYMKPALDNNLDRFAADWAGSVGE